MNSAVVHERISELFLAVCDLSEDAQTSYLDRACSDSSDIRAQVEAMLAEDSRVENVLARPNPQPRERGGTQTGSRHDPAEGTRDRRGGVTQVGLRDDRAPTKAPTIPGYRITGVLGHGGMGIVYRAVQEDLGREVALKVLPAVLGAASSSMVTRFRREAAAAARLRHDNIVPIYDFGESDDTYYYAMQLVVGEPLSNLIRVFASFHHARAGAPDERVDGVRHSPERVLSSESSVPRVDLCRLGLGERLFDRSYFERVAEWTAEIAEALHFAHGRGIVHRDVKPSNLILSAEGRMVITDFGLAMTDQEDPVTKTGAVMGTLRYMSPEQALGSRVPIDHRTDVYSLGVTLYELLTLGPLFHGLEEKQLLAAVVSRDPVAPRVLNSSVPIELNAISLRAIEKLPEARYATSGDFAEDLRAFVADRPIAARPPSITARLRRSAKRHRLRVVAVGALMLLVGGALMLAANYRKARVSERVSELIGRGLVLQQQRRFEEAVRTYSSVLELDPEDVRALGNLAIIRKDQYNARLDPDPELLLEANGYCDRALRVAPENAAIWNVKGVLLKKLGDYEEAIVAYHAAVSVDNAPPEIVVAALNNLAEVQWLVGDAMSAEENVRQAAHLAAATDTPAWYAWQDLAALELAHGDVSAADSIQRAFALRGEPNWRLLTTRARIHLLIDEVRDVDLAVRDAFAAVEQGPPDPRVERIVALAALRHGDFDQAVGHIARAIDLGDTPAFCHLIRAIAEAHREDPVEARRYLDEARRTWPQQLVTDGYAVSTERGMLWFDTIEELTGLLEEAELLLE